MLTHTHTRSHTHTHTLTHTHAHTHTHTHTHSPRAAAFYSLNGAQLGEWFQSIGLDMYSDMMEQEQVTGDKLASIVAVNSNDGLVVSVVCGVWVGGWKVCI